MSSEKLVRLQKYIADCGVTSRRKAEQLMIQGEVTVNGEIVTELGTKVSPGIDAVIVKGEAVDHKSVQPIYALLHKPRGCVTTVSDPEGRPTVMDYCKIVSERIYPVGRLDYLSEGLLILTNDGQLANQIMHPSFEVEKVYEVKVFGVVSSVLLRKLQKGIEIDGTLAKPLSVRVIKTLPQKTWLEFRLNEGKNREIRRICEEAGLTVDKLKRVAIENLTVQNIAPGKLHFLSRKELLISLNMKEDGTKVSATSKFRSIKKSVNMKKRKKVSGTSADDRAFHLYRKETYFESIETLKKIKEERDKKPKRVRARDEERKHLK